MNDFTVKKLAEVQAFIETAEVIMKRGKSFGGTSKVVELMDTAAKTEIASLVPAESKTVFDDAVAKTREKLDKMMELHVGEDWDNPVQVLEWTSFYSGAGAAHSGLVSAALRLTDSEGAFKLGNLESTYYYLLKEAIEALQAVGTERSR